MKETTVSHLNKSRQNIVADGKIYRCNKVKVFSEKKNIVYVKYLQCGMALWIKPMDQSGSLTVK